MIWDVISFVIDVVTLGKVRTKKLPVAEALAEDYAKSKEGRSLAVLKQKSLESIPMPGSERKGPNRVPVTD